MKKTDTYPSPKGLAWCRSVLTRRIRLVPGARGFTLSELLVSIAVLGFIATFTIPKVLQGFTTQREKAVLKETYASVTSLLVEATQTTTVNGSVASEWFEKRLQYVALCPWNQPATLTCPILGGSIDNWVSRLMLPNGAVVSLPSNGPSGDMINFAIDFNGKAPPNSARNSSSSGSEPFDQVSFTVCVREGGACDGKLGIPVPGYSWQNRGAFNQMFE
jgi:prepilin-type N-terminal cleavage/methylation domain-containing protein